MRSCQKPRCDGVAAATVALRYGPKEVLVTSLRAESDRRLLELCDGHASRLTAPVGWRLRDERRPAVPPQYGSSVAPAV